MNRVNREFNQKKKGKPYKDDKNEVNFKRLHYFSVETSAFRSGDVWGGGSDETLLCLPCIGQWYHHGKYQGTTQRSCVIIAMAVILAQHFLTKLPREAGKVEQMLEVDA